MVSPARKPDDSKAWMNQHLDRSNRVQVQPKILAEFH